MTTELAAALASTTPIGWKPTLFDFSKEDDRRQASELIESQAVRIVTDDFEEQLREHHAYLNPTLVFSPELASAYQSFRDELAAKAPLWQQGRWVYYPWRGMLTHVLEQEAYFDIRTSRNRELITKEEQRKYAEAVVGIAGLSIGNSVALATVLQGGANRIRLADFDHLALSNINRVRAGAHEFGRNKAEMTARQIYELNPYAEVELFTDGLTEENIDAFFGGDTPLDIVIDEIDNIAVKCLMREHAKRRRIPVIMATDNGDNGVIEIERYDLDPETPFFNGRMGEVSYQMLKGLDKMGVGRMAVKYLGADTITSRVRASMLEIGKTIVSWPQLGGAALLNGCAVAYAIRKIACGQPLDTGRALVDFDEKMEPGYHSDAARETRAREAQEFAKAFGL